MALSTGDRRQAPWGLCQQLCAQRSTKKYFVQSLTPGSVPFQGWSHEPKTDIQLETRVKALEYFLKTFVVDVDLLEDCHSTSDGMLGKCASNPNTTTENPKFDGAVDCQRQQWAALA